jgi:hypothetical protein
LARSRTPQRPPVAHRDKRQRRVGVEIEFGGLSSKAAADAVVDLFGGRVTEKDPHEHVVENTSFGDFLTKLDSRYVHPEETPLRPSPMPGSHENQESLARAAKETAETMGDVLGVLLPTEIVCPPVPWSELPAMDEVAVALRRAGAKGTRDQPWFAFGLQLNPELPGDDVDSLHRHIKAYLLSAEWLRHRIQVDLTRYLLPFVDRFPRAYIRLVSDPDYAPDLDQLITNYVHHNPTRNRELDMLPAFAHLRGEKLKALIDDPHIKPRPTFHYRLPNADLGDDTAPVTREWNRWLAVERLAAEPDALAPMAELWRYNDRKLISRSWQDLSAPILDKLAAADTR